MCMLNIFERKPVDGLPSFAIDQRRQYVLKMTKLDCVCTSPTYVYECV